MKTKFFSIVLLVVMVAPYLNAQTKIIAHRGYWKTEGSVHNSLSSLKNAQNCGLYGSELDVHLASDGVLVVYHDDKLDNMEIAKTPSAAILKSKLSNGEEVPTLEAYLKQGLRDKDTKLIIELKPKKDSLLEKATAKAVVDLVKKHRMESQVEYISFSLHLCKQLAQLQHKSPVAFLAYKSEALAPSELHKLGISGFDYHYGILLKNTQWINEAKALGMTSNCWTVNDVDTIIKLAGLGVDFVTTNEPVMAKKALKDI
ncbi:MAG: glycerophosphodiester phosphodiesterase [Paludibacter sp.]|nr:glycerophosphodiester phosphodiesterase [Paludibacter sp.]